MNASANTCGTVTLVLPCYNDSGSLRMVLPKLLDELAMHSVMVHIVVVNDRGTSDNHLTVVSNDFGVRIVSAPYNMGSQEAIVYGIRWVCAQQQCDYIVTMDADGQDDPAAIPALLDVARTGKIAVAQRTGPRPEGVRFSLLYGIYKALFRLLTGITPDFGNFAAYPRAIAEHISRSPYFSITYSLALPLVGDIVRVPVRRLPRACGESRVGYHGLFVHALRSAFPHLLVIAMRVTRVALVIMAAGMLLALTTSFMRIFLPKYAFPNWATTIALGVVGISLQLLTICLVLFVAAIITRQVGSLKSDILAQKDTVANGN